MFTEFFFPLSLRFQELFQLLGQPGWPIAVKGSDGQQGAHIQGTNALLQHDHLSNTEAFTASFTQLCDGLQGQGPFIQGDAFTPQIP